MFNRLSEFFEGEDRVLSMTRLVLFLSFVVSTVTLGAFVYMCLYIIRHKLDLKDHERVFLITAEIFGSFLTAFVVSYAAGVTGVVAGKFAKQAKPVTINQLGDGDANFVKNSGAEGANDSGDSTTRDPGRSRIGDKQ